jgi:hypothetical protein
MKYANSGKRMIREVSAAECDLKSKATKKEHRFLATRLYRDRDSVATGCSHGRPNDMVAQKARHHSMSPEALESWIAQKTPKCLESGESM